MKKIIFGLILIVIVGIVYYVGFRKEVVDVDGYKTSKVERGDIVNIVSSTGDLEPVSTVDVSTQVSGSITKVLVDFNDNVTEGQLLAVIDTFVLAAQLRDSKANLEKARASLELSQIEFDNQTKLRAKELSTQYNLDKSRINLRTAKANLAQSRASLSRTKRNLSYALIKSPINGIVIHRAVEPGQTVAASFSAPTMFVIAEDLTRMRILAYVDESDIGLVDTGMSCVFEVPAFPDKSFDGKVTQVRMQPSVVQNVVNYTVVIEADNPDKQLMPGMTATVDFLLDEKRDVLMVSNAAFSIQPSMEMVTAMREKMRKLHKRPPPKEKPADSLDAEGKPVEKSVKEAAEKAADKSTEKRGMGMMGGGMSGSTDKATLWYFDDKGEMNAMPVKKGVTDGKNTEITPMRGELPVGTEIITRIPKAQKAKKSSNLFAPKRPGR